MEQTLVLVKPDGVQRGLVGEVIGRFERLGLKLTALKLLRVTDELAERHYAEHKGKVFYEGLVTYITSAPVAAMTLEGPGAISLVRKAIGATNPAEAAPGTIRGDFGLEIDRNLVHASANLEDASREVPLFFDDSELVTYGRAVDPWVYG